MFFGSNVNFKFAFEVLFEGALIQSSARLVKTVLKGEKNFDKNIIKYIVKLFGPAPQETNPGLTKKLLLTSPFFKTSRPPHVFIHQQLQTPFPPHPKKKLTLWIALLHELGVAPTRPQCVTLKIMYAFLFGNCHKLYGMALISIATYSLISAKSRSIVVTTAYITIYLQESKVLPRVTMGE